MFQIIWIITAIPVFGTLALVKVPEHVFGITVVIWALVFMFADIKLIRRGFRTSGTFFGKSGEADSILQ